MVLASVLDAGSLADMTQLADKIMEVVTPSLTVSTMFELEHLHKKVAKLKSLLQGLQSSKQSGSRRYPNLAAH